MTERDLKELKLGVGRVLLRRGAVRVEREQTFIWPGVFERERGCMVCQVLRSEACGIEVGDVVVRLGRQAEVFRVGGEDLELVKGEHILAKVA